MWLGLLFDLTFLNEQRFSALEQERFLLVVLSSESCIDGFYHNLLFELLFQGPLPTLGSTYLNYNMDCGCLENAIYIAWKCKQLVRRR